MHLPTKIMVLTSLLTLFPHLSNATLSNPNADSLCVNSIPASTPSSQFVDNHDGTVTDNKTGLMWKQCSEGQIWKDGFCNNFATSYSWQGALQQTRTANNTKGFAGKKDWRLPNIKELSSIVERQCYNPAINKAVFANTDTYFLSGDFWASSPNTQYSGDAWFVGFRRGNVDEAVKNSSNQVRLVRGGL